MRHAEHRHFRYRRMREDDFFDFATRDVLAAGLDHVLLAIDDAQVTLAVDQAEIAAVEPAVAKCLGSDRGILPIAERHMRAAMDDPANRARRQDRKGTRLKSSH